MAINTKEKYVSGCLSGVLTTAALHPLEVLRMRLFSLLLQNNENKLVQQSIGSPKSFFNGVVFNISTSCVKHMAMYPTQEYIRDYLLLQGNSKLNAELGSSVGSGVALSCCTTPINVIKVPLQSNPDKSKVVTVVKDVYNNHGLRGFGRGGISTCLRDVTWNVSYFVLLSYLRDKCGWNIIPASLLAGGIGITLSYPLDNGRLSLQNSKGGYSFWYGFRQSFSLNSKNIGSYLTHLTRVPLANTLSHLTYLSINELLQDSKL